MTTTGRTVLIDLSGTIHIDDKEVPGSIAALKKLRSFDVNIKFVTNTTKESKRMLLTRLEEIGFLLSTDEIFTSLNSAHDAIKLRGLRPFLIVDDKAMEEFEDLPKHDPNCVLVGLAPEKFNYENMNEAFQILQEGATLIAVHKARYYKRKDGLALGPGPFISGLEYSTNTKAEIIGKPSAEFFLAAIREFNSLPRDCFMIGDDVRDDIGGAQEIGMKGFLVKTGKYRQGDEYKIEPPPFSVVSDFREAVDSIIKEISSSS